MAKSREEVKRKKERKREKEKKRKREKKRKKEKEKKRKKEREREEKLFLLTNDFPLSFNTQSTLQLKVPSLHSFATAFVVFISSQVTFVTFVTFIL